MNPDTPQPLPTPYDIADIPVFQRPIFYDTLYLFLALIALIVAVYFLTKKRGTSNKATPTILEALRRDISQAIANPSLSKKDFALCWKKIIRTRELTDTAADLVQCEKSAETLLFGGTFSPEGAKRVLEQSLSQLEQSTWRV